MADWLSALIAAKGLIVALWLACVMAGERLAPAAPLPPGLKPWPRLGRNAGLFLVNLVLSPLIVLPLTALAAGHGLLRRPAWWSGGWGLLGDLIILDFLIYWWHRANHEWPLLWRFHVVHHLDATLDSTSALRFHFGEVVLSALARATIVVALAFPFGSIVVFETLVLVAAIFHHSNLALPPGLEQALARLLITPSIHWVHHHALKRDTDANYGTVFSFWDRLFASRAEGRRTPAMPIGVEGGHEETLPRLLLRPFAEPG